MAFSVLPADNLPARPRRWYAIWLKAVARPTVGTFRDLLAESDVSFRRALKWVVLAAVAAGLLSWAIDPGFVKVDQASGRVNWSAGLDLAVSVGAVVAFLFFVFLEHALARVMGGEGSYVRLAFISGTYSALLILISGVLSGIDNSIIASRSSAQESATPGLSANFTMGISASWFWVSLLLSLLRFGLDRVALRAVYQLGPWKSLFPVLASAAVMLAVSTASLTVQGGIPAVYDEAIQSNPQNPEEYFKRGSAYYSLRRFQEAIKDFDEAIRLNPGHVEAYGTRANVYADLGEFDKAVSDLNEAIRLRPTSAIQYFNRAHVNQEVGDAVNSIKDYDQAIELNPQYVAAFVNRGSLYFALGDFRQAIKDFDEAIRLDPVAALAYTNRGAVYKDLGELAQAMKDLNDAIRLDPKNPDSYVNRGSVHNKLGEYRQAIQDYDEAIRLNAKVRNAYMNRGNAYLNLGQTKRAIGDFNKEIDLQPRSPAAYSNRGNCYLSLGEPQRAVEDFSLAIGLDPRFTTAYANRAIAYTMLGKDKKTREDAKHAVDLGFDSTQLDQLLRQAAQKR